MDTPCKDKEKSWTKAEADAEILTVLDRYEDELTCPMYVFTFRRVTRVY